MRNVQKYNRRYKSARLHVIESKKATIFLLQILVLGNVWKYTEIFPKKASPQFERTPCRAIFRSASQTRQWSHLHCRRAAEFGHKHWYSVLAAQLHLLFSWISRLLPGLPMNRLEVHPTHRQKISKFGFTSFKKKYGLPMISFSPQQHIHKDKDKCTSLVLKTRKKLNK